MYEKFYYGYYNNTTTIEKFTIIKNAPFVEKKSLNDVLEISRQLTFNFEYPFYNIENKTDFENMFIVKYFKYNINAETFADFQYYLYRHMLLNYERYKIDFDTLLSNKDITKNEYVRILERINNNSEIKENTNVQTLSNTINADVSGTNTNTTRQENNSQQQNVLSNYPQSPTKETNYVSNVVRSQNYGNNSGATTNIEKYNNSNKQTSSNNIKQNDDITRITDEKIKETLKGYKGESYIDEIIKIRKNNIALNKKIVDELYYLFSCFM